MTKIFLSTVTPVYQGAPYLKTLVNELLAVRLSLDEQGYPLELVEAIFVNDAAIDASPEILDQLQEEYTWVHVIHLSRNFGQHAATEAGILHSSGDWVATLDEDLQHHPKHLLPLLIEAVASRQDVVYGKPEGNVHRSYFRNASSQYYKKFVSWMSHNPHIGKFNSFRMIRGSIARAAAAVSAHDTYYDMAVCWFTNRLDVLVLPMTDIRTGGGDKSGYHFFRLLRHARRMLISSEIKLLRVGAAIGFLTLSVSVILIIVTLGGKLITPEAINVRGWASLMLAILFFGGLAAFNIGVVLEYMSTLLLQAQGKPTFFVVDRSKDGLLRSFLRVADTQ